MNIFILTFSTGLLESSRNLSANLVASAINFDKLGLIFFAVSNISEHLATRMWYDDCKKNQLKCLQRVHSYTALK